MENLLNTLLNAKKQFQDAVNLISQRQENLTRAENVAKSRGQSEIEIQSILKKLPDPFDLRSELTILAGLLNQALQGAATKDQKLFDIMLEAMEYFDGFWVSCEAGKRSYLIEMAFLNEIEKGLRRASVLSFQDESQKTAVRPPLGKIARLIYEKLKSLPEHKAMTTPEIGYWLAQEPHNIILDDSTINKNHMKQIYPYGLYHQPRIGWCLR